MIMQNGHDWAKHYTPEAFTFDFGLSFEGPGIYRTATDTILVFPMPPEGPPKAETYWDKHQPKDTVYRVEVWNCPYEQTVLSVLAQAPHHLR